ncbi:MAG: malate dehydrogenase [Alphaproteobacteria bacterium]|nr:malate dehydrogenase [Alphaproteobacteria bacterium]
MGNKKIAIVGAGQIGGTLALLAGQKELGDVALIDVAMGLSEGKALDLFQTSPIEGFHGSFTGGTDYNLMAGASVVIVTAGMARKPGMNRNELLNTNADIIKTVSENIKMYAPNSFVIIITNPVDIMAYMAQKITGFPSNRVVGMAGALDSARFRSFLALEFNVSVEDVHACILGGHGDTMVPMARYSSVGNIPLSDLISMGWTTRERIDAIIHRTKNGGAEIIDLLKTGSAFYAPAAAAIQMAESFLKDKKRILPCAAHLDGEYDQKDIYMGVPCIIGANGVEKIIELKLTPEEKSLFDHSATSIRNLKIDLGEES